MINTLTGVQAVRGRPGMYVGSTGIDGVHQLLWEILGNIVDQCLSRRCSTAWITLHPDETVEVRDDGPGIAMQNEDGAEFLLRVCTEMHLTPTADKHVPHAHISNFGIGIVVVNALSDRFEIETGHPKKRFRLTCERGEPSGPIEDLGESQHIGTTIRYRPDPLIFGSARMDPAILVRRLREVAACTPDLTIHLDDRRVLTLSAPNGVADLLLPLQQRSMHPPISVRGRYESVDVDVALVWDRWTTAWEIRSFANLTPTRSGSHVDGLWRGIATALAPLRRADVKPGLRAVVSVVLSDPRFANPTTDKLVAPAASAAVASAVRSITPLLRDHPVLRARLSGDPA